MKRQRRKNLLEVIEERAEGLYGLSSDKRSEMMNKIHQLATVGEDKDLQLKALEIGALYAEIDRKIIHDAIEAAIRAEALKQLVHGSVKNVPQIDVAKGLQNLLRLMPTDDTAAAQ